MSTRSHRIAFPATCWTITLLISGLAIVPAADASLIPSWITDGNAPSALYGHSAASAGDVNGDGYLDVIVGAHLYENSGGRQGRAYVYYGSAGGPSTTPDWIAEGTADDQGFGFSVACAGDVNGDGYSDVVIGRSPAYTQNGQAWVYLGSAGGLGATPAWTTTGVFGYGAVVASAGDVNGDGYSDIVIGKMYGLVLQPYDGGVWVFHGSSSGPSTNPALTLTHFSWRAGSIAPAGDVNGDGYDDLIVGVLNQNYSSYYEARILFGSSSGLASTAGWSFSIEGNYGASVAGAGDVNGDGCDDFLVGANLDDHNALTQAGRVYLYYGSAGVPNTAPDWVFNGDQSNGKAGSVVAGAGDVNADGYDDMLVGASNYDANTATQGRVYLFHGSAFPPSLTPAWVVAGDQANADFGAVVAGAGDVNGDGGADVVVGAGSYHDTELYEGRAYLYTTSLVGVPPPTVVAGLALAPPSPNPSRGRTELGYSLPARGRARLIVHDVLGRTVAVLVDGIEDAGPHTARWESAGGRIPSGVYVARLEFAGRVETRRIAVMQ